MEKKVSSAILLFVVVIIIVISLFIYFIYFPIHPKEVEAKEQINDFDPTTDLKVIFRIDRIRKIDFERGGEPLVTLRIKIDGKSYEVGKWKGIDVYPRWRHIQDVNDSKENVSIEVQLFEIRNDRRILCDISPRKGEFSEEKTLKLFYSLKNGRWQGDDYLKDLSGYGHAGGYEDGHIENDYEIWFDIYQTDADGDRLTWYEEVFIYKTNPMESDIGKDYDNDSLPIEWEDKYGYNPFIPDNINLDEDNDGLTTYEEYLMYEWHADPFRQDIFVEVDFMENRFFGHNIFPEYSKEKVISAFSKHNIMLHIDDKLEGGEILPYEKYFTPEKLSIYYKKYFLHDGKNKWREGIFRYCVFAHYTFPSRKNVAGYSYWPTERDKFNCFVIGIRVIKNYRIKPIARETAIASLFMHELGHTLGLFWHTYNGIDNSTCNYPWLEGWRKYENYKSCMNYRYAWNLIDYSNGSHGENDFNDWAKIDPAFFEKNFFAEEPILFYFPYKSYKK